jgi:aryl-alcohol dehydrogenase-like predicted oxidoreductase
MRYLSIDTGKQISKIGLGTWQFGSKKWGYGERYAREEAGAIVRLALKLGVTLFDTAEIYSAGNSERILGNALAGRWDSAFIATKVFPVIPAALAFSQRGAASARRLGVSRLDLYQVHWPNPLIRDRTIMRGMRSLQRSGRVAEVGVSNYSVERWRAAEEALGGRVLSNQVEYSLVTRSPELRLMPFAESRKRVIIAFSPLAQGFLSGNYHGPNRPTDPLRSASHRFSPVNIERSTELITVLRDIAHAHRASPAQIALAWTIRRPFVVAIPGASSVAQLESNVAAAEIDLADDEYQALNDASALYCAPSSYGKRGRPLASMKHLIKCGLLLAETVREDQRQNLPRDCK